MNLSLWKDCEWDAVYRHWDVYWRRIKIQCAIWWIWRVAIVCGLLGPQTLFFINVRCIIKSHIYSSWVLRFYVWYIFYYEMKWSQVFWKEVYIYYPMVVKLFVKLLWMSLENKKSVGSFTLLVLLCNLKNLSL